MASKSVQILEVIEVSEIAAQGAIRVTEKGFILEVDLEAAEMLGYLPAELLTLSFTELLPLENRTKECEKLWSGPSSTQRRVETCLLKKSGELLWVLACANPAVTEAENAGEVDLVIFDQTELVRLRSEALEFSQSLDHVMREKTQALLNAHAELEREASERRQAEDQLCRTQAEFQSFFDSSPLHIGIIDLTEDGIKHVIDTPSVNRFFGLGEGETAGKLARELNVPPESLRQWKIRCEQSRAEKKAVQWEFTTMRDSTTLRTFSCYTSFIGITNEAHQRFSYTCEEITEKREMERKREEQNLRLSHLSKMSALGEMASGIAHEIYNPLTIIKGYADLLAKRGSSGVVDPLELLSITHEIQNTCRRMNKIIEGLRFFAREGSQDPLDYTSVDGLVSATAKICAERFKKYGVTLELVHHDQDLSVACRDVQISQVILNLLNNAFDAVRNEERKNICIETEAHEKHILIRIQDSGPGVPENLRSKIFEPFFTTKPIGLGTGMGLSICKGIMEAHLGSIDLIPSSQGACFQLRLPQGQSAEETSRKGH